ncbi:MAG: RND transporter [Rhodobacteraceae bacterium]|nr:MAG: RND transporter [Paracoccaceae bacterium]
MKLLDKIPFRTAIIMTIFLGLAPFVPEPHIWQKLKMLAAGDLVKPIDFFDMLFHTAPAMILLAKIYRRKTGADQSEG